LLVGKKFARDFGIHIGFGTSEDIEFRKLNLRMAVFVKKNFLN
jgi:hypothetical protein